MRWRVERGRVGDRRNARSRWLTYALAAIAIALAPGLLDSALAKTRHRNGVSPQIIGGQPVDPGQDRFVVALLDTTHGATQFQQQFCGGSIIGRKYVLTAAHCMEDARPGDLRVLIDQVELNDVGGLTITVKTASVDPDFNNVLFANDAAVLTLAKKIPRKRSQQIALVQPGDGALEQAGDVAAVAGWGNTSTSENDFPTHLMQADVKFVADSECATAYPGQFDSTSMVCAAGQNPPRDSCQGDSGDPLFANGDSAQPVQIGIVSFGEGCAQAGFPGVYTRLSDPGIAHWIHDATSKHRTKKHRHR